MKRTSVLMRVITLLAALCMIGAVGSAAVSAAPQGDDSVQSRRWNRDTLSEWYDYIYNYNDDDSTYEEPDHLSDLPAAEDGIEEATAVAMPAVEVSDATLFSGIVMWLCVALGIAVIVGVLVSRRTGRRG